MVFKYVALVLYLQLEQQVSLMYVFLDLWRCVNGFMEILMVGGHFSYERTYNTILYLY